ncbi:MAG: response regulator [Rhodobacteraceae bacterium]|nr:response regulator [Paracoccaceae bacterium]
MIAANQSPDYSNLRFLVADDKSFVRGLVQSMLLRLQVKQIKHASSGEEALTTINANGGRYDCVISDWNMEPGNGIELLRSLRMGKTEAPADICFIMLTGHADAHVVNTALALDVSGYIVKPVSFENLSKAIHAAWNRKISVKDPSVYEKVETVSTPNTVDSVDKITPPWVMWVRRAASQDAAKARIEKIRQEVAAAQKSKVARAQLKNVSNRAIDLIPPGLVLAEDIYTDDGNLLLAEGIVLNASLLNRLKELASESGETVSLKVGEQ